MTDEIYLKQTSKTVGELLPILVNKKGEVIDGKHRKETNPKWKKQIIPLDPLQTHVARLVINTQRRTAETNDYDELAKFLQKTELPIKEKPYQLKSGKTIAERITELTGIPYQTVISKLSSGFKQKQKVTDTVTLGKGEQVRVPESLAVGVKELTEVVKKAVAASPERKDAIIQSVKNDMQESCKDLTAQVKAEKVLKRNQGQNVSTSKSLRDELDRYMPLSEKGRFVQLIEEQGTPQAINLLVKERAQSNEPLTETEARDIILGLEPVNATQIISPILRHMSLISYTCKVCNAEQELDKTKLKFTISKPDLKKLEEDLARAQTKLTVYA